jgi:hypothetical protein
MRDRESEGPKRISAEARYDQVDADSHLAAESAPAAFSTTRPYPAVAETAATGPAQSASERAFGGAANPAAARAPAAAATGATLLFSPDGLYVGYITTQGERVERGTCPDKVTYAAVLDRVDARVGNITSTYRLNDPAKDSAPTMLTIHDPHAIEILLDDSGVNQPRGFIEKYRYAYQEGRGRLMDYMQSLELQSRMGLHAIRGDSIAYNAYDFGNLLWGMGMKRLGFSRAATIAGSQANAILNAQRQFGQGPRFQLDDPADQRAIRAGHGSELAATIPESLDRGELHGVESTRTMVFDQGLGIEIEMAASAGARYRTVDVTIPELGANVVVHGRTSYRDGKVVILHHVPWSQLPASGKVSFEAHLRGERTSLGELGYRSSPVRGVVELPQQPNAPATRDHR